MLLDRQESRAVVDFLRGLGIVLVICFHVVFGLTRLLEGNALTDYIAAIPAILNVFWQALGSELVFLFSGFLLSYLLIREHRRHGRIDFRDFYVRRMSRIVPLYLVALLLYALVRDFTPLELLLNLLFVSKLFDAETIIPVGWSLEVLVQAYLVLPVLTVFLLQRRHVTLLVAVAILASLVIRFVALLYDPASYELRVYEIVRGVSTTDTQDALYYHLSFRATPFLLGYLLAHWVHTWQSRLTKLFASALVSYTTLGAALLLVLASGFLPIHDGESAIYAATGDSFWLWFWTLQRFVFAVGVSLFALSVWFGKARILEPLRWLIERKLWRHLSQSIYSIYLFHPVFLIPAAAIGLRATRVKDIGPITVIEVIVIITIVVAMSLLLARFLTRFIERPAQAWLRRKFRSR